MNKFASITVMILSAIIVCTSCNKEDIDTQSKIEGLTLENFPIIDGSTSTDPLVRLIACKLLGYDYKWEMQINGADMIIAWTLATDLPLEFVQQHLKSSQTHNAFINLIDKKADMIFSARKLSTDEKAYAVEAGVSLIEMPIALDALIFIEHPYNQVQSLTHKQLQDIYTGKIKQWNEVGGNDAPINPYIRNRNSGSQELFENLVLANEQIPDNLPLDIVPSMMGLISAVGLDVNGLGYTVYYYIEHIVRETSLRRLEVNGVYPDKDTIKNKKYPYTSEVFVIIRSNLDQSSMAYKIYELLQTEAGKQVISESGYVPN